LTTFTDILAIDPSGNFKEGKGITGWAVFEIAKNKVFETGTIKAEDYKTRTDYWQNHIALIHAVKHPVNTKHIVVMENFTLYGDRANSQINSELETPRLLGILELTCAKYFEKYVFQNASQVKNRWNNMILEHKGYIKKLNAKSYTLPDSDKILTNHELDAIRHAVHLYHFYKGENTWN